MSIAEQIETARTIYEACPIDSTNSEIRVLHIGPVGADGILEGTLHNSALDGNSKFDALSYVWGSEEDRAPFRLNGTETSITRNLAVALARLASEDKARNIWVDAVCINQLDEIEKPAQVRMMGEIYKSAQKTYIWLGEAEDDSDLVMDLIGGISDSDFENYKPDDPTWRALWPLSQRPWWTRTWIIPEAVLSVAPTVKCGTKEIPLERFSVFWELHKKYFYSDPDKYAGIRPFQSVPFRRLFYTNLKQWIGSSLYLWLFDVTEFQCKYMRDRVYSLLSLVGESSRQAITVDYSRNSDGTFVKSDRQFALEITKLLFYEAPGLTALITWRPKWHPDLKMPSWCPNWTTGDRHYNELSPSSQYNAWPGSTPFPWLDGASAEPNEYHSGKKTFTLSENGELLKLRGHIVDTIDYSDACEVEPIYDGQDNVVAEQSTRSRRMKTLEACKRWLAHVQQAKPQAYTHNGGIEPVFWRTVIGDRIMGSNTIPEDSLKDSFDAWMSITSELEDISLSKERREFVRKYSNSAVFRCMKRCFFTTSKDYFGLGPVDPTQARDGDIVVLIHGGTTPFILRPSSAMGEAYYTFVGEAYVHGIMAGEYLEEASATETVEFWLK